MIAQAELSAVKITTKTTVRMATQMNETIVAIRHFFVHRSFLDSYVTDEKPYFFVSPSSSGDSISDIDGILSPTSL